ncbi:MAG: hypothetical protein LH660_04415 [Phormidesmis sp. CAN_BIN36]|nr:hypothetical protein [Phormidesmis sp. CAN_BIN36]
MIANLVLRSQLSCLATSDPCGICKAARATAAEGDSALQTFCDPCGICKAARG